MLLVEGSYFRFDLACWCDLRPSTLLVETNLRVWTNCWPKQLKVYQPKRFSEGVAVVQQVVVGKFYDVLDDEVVVTYS